MLDIIGFVYQYLKLLSQDSPQEWIFKELQNIGSIDFKFVEEQPEMIMLLGLQVSKIIFLMLFSWQYRVKLFLFFFLV